jgi:hypothetical protein
MFDFRAGGSDTDFPKFQLASVLAKGERGGLVSPPGNVKRTADGGLSMTYLPPDDSVVKTALLFVDKIDIPDNNINSFGVGELGAVPIVARSRVQFAQGPTYDQMNVYPWLAFKQLDEREPGRWSIWQRPDKALIPAEELSPDLAFQIEFTKALVVPDATVPFDDVINFRERHRDQLITLRHHIEEMAIKLSKEGDKRAITHEVEKFDASLSSYLKEARKSNLRKAVTSLTAEMDWSAAVRDSLFGGGGMGLLSVVGGFSLAQAAAAIGGGVATALSIKSAAGLKKAEPSPFRYIARVEQEYGS